MSNKTNDNNSTVSRSTFSGKIGYVLAVAGSAVGLGNIWRFPYLAAKYGGGMFLLTYLVLMVTFGYSLIISETAMGRMTKKSPVGAFEQFGKTKAFRFGGWMNAIIPVLIVPYYSVIGGWVTKYLAEYLRGNATVLAGDTYFTDFMSNSSSALLWFLVFSAMIIVVILAGVEAGIERISKIMMPILVVLAVIVAAYSVTRPGAIEGVKYFLIPNFKNFSPMTIVAAMGQMFYSLSIAMGILYTYGSYLQKDVDIEATTIQVQWFDTGIAVLSGLMVIPAVFAFSGSAEATLQSGPSLMFVTIPKVFANMGFGTATGIMFFLLVLLAALTSAIALMETAVSTFVDQLKWSRKQATAFMAVVMVVLGSLSALGFGVLDFVKILGMSILDFFDFTTNSVMMPIAALCTCILILRVVGLNKIAEEVEISSKFKRKKLYFFFIKYLAIACIAIILLSSIADVLGIISL